MKLLNCKCKWAKLITPDEMSAAWQIDLYPDQATLEQLKAEGIEPKLDDDGQPYVTAKRGTSFKTGAKAGTRRDPPMVVDGRKQPFNKLIGNGSIVNAIVGPYDWTFSGKKGRALGLEAVQVVTLVEYTGGDSFDNLEPTDMGGSHNEFDDLPFK